MKCGDICCLTLLLDFEEYFYTLAAKRTQFAKFRTVAIVSFCDDTCVVFCDDLCLSHYQRNKQALLLPIIVRVFIAYLTFVMKPSAEGVSF